MKIAHGRHERIEHPLDRSGRLQAELLTSAFTRALQDGYGKHVVRA